MKKNNCMVFVFTLGNIMSYCKANSKAIKPHPTNCAKYVNCSATDSIYGKFIQECTYPQLFSSISLRCEKFESVTCIPRNEPQAPCKCLPCIPSLDILEG